MQDRRLCLIESWLKREFAKQDFSILPIQGDASFRRYFRVYLDNKTFVLMDAPPSKEDCKPFIKVAQILSEVGVNVPTIHKLNLTKGFLLLTDYGDRLLSKEVNKDNAKKLYIQAIDEILKIQSYDKRNFCNLPAFDTKVISDEWNIFIKWFIKCHLSIEICPPVEKIFDQTFNLIIREIKTQPIVCIHKDYHSRNLLCLTDKIGVIDFQDAAWGPIVYDLVSLLRDCYIKLPPILIEILLKYFYENSRIIQKLKGIEFNQYIRWFDLMSIQRNLKAIGIYARLGYLYKRSNYLKYIPQGLNHVIEVSKNYPELLSFCDFLQNAFFQKYTIKEANFLEEI